MQQRGVPHAVIDLICKHGDREKHVGGGCRSLSISRNKSARLIKAGIPAQSVEKAKDVVLVEGSDGQIVTIMHVTGRGGRRYR